MEHPEIGHIYRANLFLTKMPKQLNLICMHKDWAFSLFSCHAEKMTSKWKAYLNIQLKMIKFLKENKSLFVI